MLVSTATCVYSIFLGGSVSVCVCTGFFCLLNNLQVIWCRGQQPHKFLGAAAGSPYIVFISTSGM